MGVYSSGVGSSRLKPVLIVISVVFVLFFTISMLQAPSHELRHIPPAARSKTQVRSLEDMASSRSRTPQRNLSRSYSESSDTNSTREGQRESLDLSDQSDREERKRVRTCPTFFSIMQVSFVQICCNEDGGIPIPKFLESCLALAAVFDKLSATAFAPVKMDFTGNVKKIQQKYSTNPEQFHSLQSLVLYEKKAKESTNPNSGTQALLWLKRGLEFISLFLQELAHGEEDLSAAAHKAYSKTLKPYHGWVVRGMFGLAMKAAPYKKQFFEHLAVSRTHCANPGFSKQVVSDIKNYTGSLQTLLKKINKFYSAENLHSIEPV